MDGEVKKTADWEPGTLDKTRKNIGSLDADEAANMARKLGGEVLYERTSSGSGMPTGRAPSKPQSKNNSQSKSSSSSSSTGSSSGAKDRTYTSLTTPRKYTREELPRISKRTNTLIDKLMMSPDYKIKPNFGFFNFIRNWQKNGTEKVLPELYEFSLKQRIEHMENFITVIKTLIQIAPSTYKAKIANAPESKFKFLRMVASWAMQPIRAEFFNLENAPQPILVSDLIPLVRAMYKPLITVYYFGENKIPKLIKEIYNDEVAYPDAPKDKLSGYAKQAITEWLYITNEIVKKMYPLLMRMCSTDFDTYPTFFNSHVAQILKFEGLHKFDLLLPEKPQEQKQEEKKPKIAPPPQKGIKDSTVETGLKLLNQLFPQAGFDKLDDHPDMYPYFQPLYNFEDGFNLLSPQNPIQVIMVLQRIIEDCIQGCRNIRFVETEQKKPGSESIFSIMDEWSAYREDNFERLYCEPLIELANAVYSQPEYDKTRIGKKTITSLLWQNTYHFMPNFKFDQLLLEHPTDESKYSPLFHRTDYARKYLTAVINECDTNAENNGKCKLIENPWEHYKFDIANEVSKRLDVILGAQNKTAKTNATNANLLKYTLCFISVLDWWINNPDSPAYQTDPMEIYRISPADGKPLFTVEERNDQNKLFIESIKTSYRQKAE